MQAKLNSKTTSLYVMLCITTCINCFHMYSAGRKYWASSSGYINMVYDDDQII